jgi:hypothetical protein
VREEKSRIHDIERAAIQSFGFADVCAPKVYVRHALLCCFRPRELQLRLVNVETNDGAMRIDPTSQLERRVSTTTADVDAGKAVTKPKAVEEGHRTRLHDAREQAKPFPSFEATPDYVVSGIRHYDVMSCDALPFSRHSIRLLASRWNEPVCTAAWPRDWIGYR